MPDFGPPILFVDLDDTVRHGHNTLRRFVDGPQDVAVFPSAKARIAEWRAKGGIAIGATNQSGAARGFFTMDQLAATNEETRRQAGLDLVLACPHHPDAKCPCRKPLPGLLHQGFAWAARQYGAPSDPGACLMVGDMHRDLQAGRAAGVPVMWDDQWRGDTASRPARSTAPWPKRRGPVADCRQQPRRRAKTWWEDAAEGADTLF